MMEEVMHFYVNEQDPDECNQVPITDFCMVEGEPSDGAVQGKPSLLGHFLTSSAILVKVARQQSMPTIDYTKSAILTSFNYVTTLENRSATKEATIYEQEEKRKDSEATKKKRAKEKKAAKVEKLEQMELKRLKQTFDEY